MIYFAVFPFFHPIITLQEVILNQCTDNTRDNI